MVIAFGTKEARDQLMTGMQKLEYNVSPRDLEDLNGCTAPTEVVIAFPNDNGWLVLTPSGIDLADSSVRKMKAKIKRKTAKLLRWKNKNHLSGDKAAKAMIKVFDRKFFGKDSEHDLTWSRWFFPVLTTDAGLHALDAYLVENIRCLYTGRHYKGNYRITYDHIHSIGYKSLVGEYYKYRTSK